MTQLEKLYNSIQNLKELGVQLPEKLIEETNRIEEEIIKNDIIPALAAKISPVINQIKRLSRPRKTLHIWLIILVHFTSHQFHQFLHFVQPHCFSISNKPQNFFNLDSH